MLEELLGEIMGIKMQDFETLMKGRDLDLVIAKIIDKKEFPEAKKEHRYEITFQSPDGPTLYFPEKSKEFIEQLNSGDEVFIAFRGDLFI